VLGNGLRLIVHEQGASEAVALHLWVGVGARDEAPSERGFSHFLEHMLFKGTTSRGPGFIDREVEAFGGRTNAGTSWDYTFYYVLLPATRAVQALEVLADMAFNSALDPGELTRERAVVFEEMRLADDNARTFLGRRLFEMAFPGHPYGYPVLGAQDTLRAASRETLGDYYNRHYVPDKMVLVVVGAIRPGEILAMAERVFGRVPSLARRRSPVPTPPGLDGGRRQVIGRPERQASVGLGWLAPPLGHADMDAVDLMAHILGGSRTSRLHQTLRERAPLVASVSAHYSALQAGGLLTITAQCEPDDVERVEAAILAEVKRLQAHGVSAEEHERAITAAEAQHAFSIETAEGRAYAYGSAETLWSLEGELAHLERIRSVSREQILAAARRYLSEPHTQLALLPRDRLPR
jgi:zinc protease